MNRDNVWHLAPAYDLLPSDGINGFRTTSINDSIEPSRKDLIAVALKVGLDKKEAEDIYENMADIVGKRGVPHRVWPRHGGNTPHNPFVYRRSEVCGV